VSPVTALTWVLPHRLLSSLARALAYSDAPRTRRWLIDTVVRRFGVDAVLHHAVVQRVFLAGELHRL